MRRPQLNITQGSSSVNNDDVILSPPVVHTTSYSIWDDLRRIRPNLNVAHLIELLPSIREELGIQVEPHQPVGQWEYNIV